MGTSTAAIKLTEEQVLFFRARRGHLAGAGAADATAAAGAIMGAQSQQLGPSLLALSQRIRGRPSATRVQESLMAAPRRLVRTWGQRDTIHVYDAARDWPSIVAARPHWSPPGRRGAMPPRGLLQEARRTLLEKRVVTRSDLIPLLSRGYIRQAEERTGLSGDAALRFAAGRLLWKLTHAGDACVAGKSGAEQEYASREAWFPDLSWPDPLPSPEEACAELASRYLSVCGPATAADLAHFFGARISRARAWVRQLEKASKLVPIDCGERAGLVALAEDADELRETPPGPRGWPVRLLPLWDTLLMGHADKSWTVPAESERKQVWKPSAVVAAVVIARGRVVATWSQTKKTRRLEIAVQPLGLWRRSYAASIRREAKAIADHQGLGDATVTIA